MLKYSRNKKPSISTVDSMQTKIQPVPVIRVMYGIVVTVMLPLKELWRPLREQDISPIFDKRRTSEPYKPFS